MRPRKRTQRASGLNIITVTGDGFTSEHATHATGDTFSLTLLPGMLREAPPSLVVCTNHAEVFAMLNHAYDADPEWDWQISVQQKRMRADSRFAVEEISITIVGWKGRNRKRGRWHHFLDPAHFAPNTPWPTDMALYDFAVDVRAFLAEFELHPTPRAGGIAAQLLRHPDIYETPRRQVPRFINDQARRGLPGNHYQFVDGQRHKEYSDVWYLDQEASHHDIARKIELPHADHLVAVGRYGTRRNPESDRENTDPADRIWLAGNELDRFLKWQPKGLLYGRLRWRDKQPGLKHNGYDPAPYWYNRLVSEQSACAYVFTNELPMLDAYGVDIEYLIAGWVSTKRDECLPFYAEFALIQTRQADGIRRIWLKPTLHAVYGMLAARTARVEFVRRTGRGKPRTVLVNNVEILGSSSGPRTFVPKISNVIQRGMIEAETRRRSCLLALSLRRRGHRVLSIYADGVLVESRDGDGSAPIIPGAADGVWRAKERLTHLTYNDETHFQSAELIRWPGQATHRRETACAR